MHSIDTALLRLALLKTRQIFLRKIFVDLLQLLNEQGYRYSDLLEVQSEYARDESRKIQAEYESWELLATLLEAAAKTASKQGEELP